MNERGELRSTFLTVDDFAHTNFQMKEPSYTDNIDRSQFAHLLVDSFSASVGDSKLQVIFFQWVQSKIGFDYMSSLKNFVKAGSWDTLTFEEKIYIRMRLKSVYRHRPTPRKKLYVLEDFAKNPKLSLNTQINDVDDIGDLKRAQPYINRFVEKFGELSLLSLADLRRYLLLFKPLAQTDDLEKLKIM